MAISGDRDILPLIQSIPIEKKSEVLHAFEWIADASAHDISMLNLLLLKIGWSRGARKKVLINLMRQHLGLEPEVEH